MLTPEGRQSIQDAEKSTIDAIACLITTVIIGGAYAAMDNYGTGHLMDTNNPALENYKQSRLWNELRPGDNSIVGRKAGKYLNIFGMDAESSGKRAGMVIEYPRGNIVPLPPSHALQTAARWLANGEVQAKIKSTIMAFPFHKYIIADTERR